MSKGIEKIEIDCVGKGPKQLGSFFCSLDVSGITVTTGRLRTWLDFHILLNEFPKTTNKGLVFFSYSEKPMILSEKILSCVNKVYFINISSLNNYFPQTQGEIN